MSVSTQKFKIKPLGLSQEDLVTLRAVFDRFESLGDVVVFGSRAMGTQKRGSDVDLALLGTVSEDLLFHVRDALEESTLPYFFDVLVYEEIGEPELKKHIDTYGVLIRKKTV